jgi:hypothetical protein
MKAIVLTYDRYHAIADHMLHCYKELWPDNPFTFIIPYQKYPEHLKVKYNDKIQLVNSDKSIQETMKSLLSELDNEEWIYWCMDDRYPIQLDVEKINNIISLIKNSDIDIDGVSHTYSLKDRSVRFRYLWQYKFTDKFDNKFYRKKHYGSIWSHQFLKAKVLKKFFFDMPHSIKSAKEMDYYLLNNAILPKDFKLYVSSNSHALYGESSSRGEISRNCFESMKNYKLNVPSEMKVTESRIIYNSDDLIDNSIHWRIKDIIKYIF